MDKIAVLPKETAQLIAAGEVVERPASVVKELVENAIDAGASAVTVDISDGGTTSIRVQDNGSGMSEADARACFLRHATSKVRSAEDIYRVQTLGFRGEALASIAAVARIRLVTKRAEDETGTLVRMEGGTLVEQSPFGCPDGTVITVSDLFYNTPARKKFLKSVRSETSAILALMDRLALSHPEISFRVLSQGREELFTPGDGVLRNAIHAVLGARVAEALLPVEYKVNGVSITGYITKPLFARGNRNMQYFFINDRTVQSKTLYAALDAAYKGSIMAGKFPGCILHIAVDPSRIDVNVHPTKSVVKFSDENEIFNYMLRAVHEALRGEVQQFTANLGPQPAADRDKSSGRPAQKRDLSEFFEQDAVQPAMPAPPKPAKPVANLSSPGAPEAFGWNAATYRDASVDVNIYDTVPTAPKHDAASTFADGGGVLRTGGVLPDSISSPKAARPDLPAFRIEPPASAAAPEPVSAPEALKQEPLEPVLYIGEVLRTYLIAQRGDEVYFVDKHAAHERILYDQLVQAGDAPVSQPLLLSRTLLLGKREKSALLENADSLERCGFEIGDLGGGMLTVRSVPQVLDDDDVETALSEIADELLAGKSSAELSKLDSIRAVTACKAAVKAGQKNDPRENEALLERLFSQPDLKYCPHGRPLIYTLTKRDFEKFFKRVV